jgi:hypothetical protein
MIDTLYLVAPFSYCSSAPKFLLKLIALNLSLYTSRKSEDIWEGVGNERDPNQNDQINDQMLICFFLLISIAPNCQYS